MNALVRQIAVLSVLWAVCELLLPDGKHQHMVRVTASLLVMTALLTTVNGWLGSVSDAQPTMMTVVQQTADNTYRRTALTAMANQIQNYCERMASRAGYLANAAVYLNMEGAVDHVNLTIHQQEGPMVSAERLAGMLADQLGVDREQIRLSVEGS